MKSVARCFEAIGKIYVESQEIMLTKVQNFPRLPIDVYEIDQKEQQENKKQQET